MITFLITQLERYKTLNKLKKARVLDDSTMNAEYCIMAVDFTVGGICPTNILALQEWNKQLLSKL